jgi:enoyl-CoA hydratase
MGTLVTYELSGSVATITMDDGKVNALSLQMLAELGAALDRAAADGAVVLLTGRERRFTAGFDLGVLTAGGPDGFAMLRTGFELAARLLEFPTPVVMACNGHAIAMGVFLLCSADYRIGAEGPYKLTANEVAIGLALPRVAVEICRQRLVPAHFNRALLLAEVYSPDGAVAAGFLDRVVPAADLPAAANAVAGQLATLDMRAHSASKRAVRESALETIRALIDTEFPSDGPSA